MIVDRSGTMVMDIPLEIAELSGARDKLNLDLVSVREAIAETKCELGRILKSRNEGTAEPIALKSARKALDRLLQREADLQLMLRAADQEKLRLFDEFGARAAAANREHAQEAANQLRECAHEIDALMERFDSLICNFAIKQEQARSLASNVPDLRHLANNLTFQSLLDPLYCRLASLADGKLSIAWSLPKPAWRENPRHSVATEIKKMFPEPEEARFLDHAEAE